MISRDGEPVVRIVREVPAKKKPLLGVMKGQFLIDDRFFEPPSEEELAPWYDGKI